MQKKSVVIKISAIILIMILFAIYLNFFAKEISQSPERITEGCKTFKINNNRGINIVFFATKEQTQKYYDSLEKIKPFDKEIEKFNFYFIDDYDADCEIYQG